MHRIVIFGNSGSGKTTMARELSRRHGLPHLDLDSLAWDVPAVRKPLDESNRLLENYLDEHEQWVIEGCYADLLAGAISRASELRFLNPGIEACIRNCRSRPWEPEKYLSSRQARTIASRCCLTGCGRTKRGPTSIP